MLECFLFNCDVFLFTLLGCQRRCAVAAVEVWWASLDPDPHPPVCRDLPPRPAGSLWELPELCSSLKVFQTWVLIWTASKWYKGLTTFLLLFCNFIFHLPQIWSSSCFPPQFPSRLSRGRPRSSPHRQQGSAHGSTAPPVCWSVQAVAAGTKSGSSSPIPWPPRQRGSWPAAPCTPLPGWASWCSVILSPPSWALHPK